MGYSRENLGAGALDEAVRQKLLAAQTKHLLHTLLQEVTVLLQAQENLLRDLSLRPVLVRSRVFAGCTSKQTNVNYSQYDIQSIHTQSS